MPRKPGSPNKITRTVKDAVERAFNSVNHDGEYLIHVARSDPKTFLAIVARCIPAAVAVNVSTHAINLGREMLLAQEKLKQFNRLEHKVIDITPETPAPDTVKPLISKDKT